jgi:hypothetical protein
MECLCAKKITRPDMCNEVVCLFLGLQSGHFTGSLSTKILCAFLVSSILATCPAHRSLLVFTALRILDD